MKRLSLRCALLLLLASCSTYAPAQGFRVEGGGPPKPAAETFTSLDSRFSISLPRQISGFGPITIDTPNGKVTIGSSYSWRREGTEFQVGHVDYSRMPNAPADSKALVAGVAGNVAGESEKRGGRLIHNREVGFRGGSARELKVEFPDGSSFLNRVVATNGQLYQVLVTFKRDAKQEEAAAKILDSFRALSPADVEEAMAKKVEEATPGPLPQSPAAPKLKSDAEDQGLRGRVRTVLEEVEYLSSPLAAQRRKPSSLEYYDERGNLTKLVSYDYKGNPMNVVVYGYIDGARASQSGSVRHEYDPPPVMAPPAPAGQTRPKYDPRYRFKYEYKYDDKGRLSEEVRYGNNGGLWMRERHNYSGGQKETLAYDAEGKLTRKNVATLDARGNAAERAIYDIKTDKVSERYSYSYEFDTHGNWTKLTMSKLEATGGEPRYEPYSVFYRTITYY
jgi:YD repeat-containing protein